MKEPRSHIVLKKILFGLIVLVLFIPMFQHKFRYFIETPLGGAYTSTSKPKFSAKEWFSGKFQGEQEVYISEHTGFRPSWVRFYNQWNFNLFKKASTKAVVVGKENYLYETGYIHAYFGNDFLGESKIQEISHKWKAVQDTLRTKGVELVVVFAPGKASFYPEYLPQAYRKFDKRKRTNHEVFIDEFSKSNVSFIDMHTWFESMKKNSKYPLFSKTGIHWTAYGQYFATDSLVKYVSSVTHTALPTFVLDGIEVSDTARLSDDDIGQSLNLLVNIPDLPLAYPKFHASRESQSSDPKVLVIGDSFYWGLFNANVSHLLFNKGEFWYYNELIYPQSFEHEAKVKDQDLGKKLLENKVVFLLITDANLPKFGYGFLEQAYSHFFSN